MNTWINKDVRLKIKKVFEPRYKRELSSIEVVEIANNLTAYMEQHTKFIWKLKHEH